MSFQKFLWVVAGAEPSILEKCPTEHKKFSAIGATILMTSGIAFLAGSCAAWYFSKTDTTDGSLGWAACFGVVWCLLIFCIDRALVITLKKDPSNPHQSFWTAFLVRLLLAIIIAFMVSIPLELYIFRDVINENVVDYENRVNQRLEDSMTSTADIEANKRVTAANKDLDDLRAQVNEIDTKIKLIDTKITRLLAQKDKPTTGAYKSAESSYTSASRQIADAQRNLREEHAKEKPLKTRIKSLEAAISKYNSQMGSAQSTMRFEREKWNRNIDVQIRELEGTKKVREGELKEAQDQQAAIRTNIANDTKAIQEKDNEVKQAQGRKQTTMKEGNHFLRDFQILSFAVDNSDDFYLWGFLWLIRLLFIIIEIMPTVVKIVMPVGAYEFAVQAEEKSLTEYFSSAEYIDSMKDIRRAEVDTQLEEARLRSESEIRIKKDIIERMTAAQVDVANRAIANWEKVELAKLQNQSAIPPSQPTTATHPTARDDSDGKLSPKDIDALFNDFK